MAYWIRPKPQPGDLKIEFENFPVYKQETDHTCGPSCVRMVLEFMGLKIPEAELAKRCHSMPWGTFHYPVLWGYRSCLNKIGKTASMAANRPDVYELIKNELAANRPPIMIFAVVDEFHPPRLVLHYGVIVGIDEPAGIVSIANPFGRIEKMPIDEWWERFSLEPEYLTPLSRFLVITRLLKPRTCFIVSDIK